MSRSVALALLGVLTLQIVTRRLVGPRRVRSDAAAIEGEISE